MDWLDTPPCTSLDLLRANDEVVELKGPRTAQKVASGIAAGFGATFAVAGLVFLRAPFPMPFRLIPLVHTAVGTAIGAAGFMGATGEVTMHAERRGLTLRWKTGLTKQRERFFATADIAGFDVNATERRVGSDEWPRYVTEFRLYVVTKDGTATALEIFDTPTQAKLRKEALERVLLPKARLKPKVKAKKRAA